MYKNNKDYWDKFYKKSSLQKESNFARYVHRYIIKNFNIENFNIIDVGCGNGRDIFFFHKKDYNILGVDQSKVAIKMNKKIL